MFLSKFLRAKILIFSSVLRASFSKEFLDLKDQSSFVFKVFDNSKKIVFWELIFGLFYNYLEIFPSDFL